MRDLRRVHELAKNLENKGKIKYCMSKKIQLANITPIQLRVGKMFTTRGEFKIERKWCDI